MKKALRRTIIVLIAIMTLAIATVTVNANSNSAVTSVNIKKAATTLNVGRSEGLALSYSYIGSAPDKSDINWKSSNNSVATVSSNGVVKAKKNGTATITVEFDGEEDTCTVKVTTSAKWVNANGAYTELNKYRKAKKMKALKKDASLEKIAKIRAEEMAKTGKFSHTRPNGKSGLTLIKTKKAKGENIAMGQKTCAQVSKAWYNSKGHRANMLRKKFTRVGIACYEYNGVTYWAQVFAG